MAFRGPVPINTTVEVRTRGHEGKIGRVTGYDLDPETEETLNWVGVLHNDRVDRLLVPGEELEPVKYNAEIWKKNCWTPPKEGV